MDAASVRVEPREVFARIGGDVCLDLVNTVDWRLSATRRIEHLAEFADLVRWAVQTGLIDAAEAAALTASAEADPQAAAAELDRVVALREAFYAAAFEAGPADPVTAEHAAAVAAGGLQQHDDEWRWRHPVNLALPRRRIAIAMLDLLRHGRTDRLRQCGDAACGWVFLDTSPRHNRRWCVSEDCGNRNRVRGYYARTRAAAG
ncbi:CGNR zinc finger domain-containing protein [Microbacterium sp. zg-YB36]|uniref:CGNR zinc finger domain-containing protein n=1 Tax=Microbacterium sp. zg-YB36 TaxID=2969407 RepID=UPI00214C5B27|nr:CGNR zinc finger domain-containing protein [Microbacterium sp. zg-YB36]MDL5351480.1 CGNR zinc finger domain-containing protein [Microbacterium sp. zg-YB36]